MTNSVIDPNDVVSTALNVSFHLTLTAKICSSGDLIFIPEHNTEYTKYMIAHAPCLDEGEKVLGFDTELVVVWPNPIDSYVRLGSFSSSVNYESMHFFIMTFSRGYDLNEVIQNMIKQSGEYKVTIEVVPISEENSHGV